MTARKGFTLIEMLVATVLATIILGAVYQTLTVQQRGARRLEVIVNTQQTVRTGVQMLQSELREVGASAGDIEEAASDHIRIRALRKAGIVCAVIDASTLSIYTFGDTLVRNDTVSVNDDKSDTNTQNDEVLGGVITDIATVPAGTCTMTTGAPWANMNTQARTYTLSMAGGKTVSTVTPGAAVRSFVHVTYGVYSRGGKFVFGRRDVTSTDTVATLMAPLAANGLTFSYIDTAQNIIDPTTAALRGSIGRIRVTITGRTPGYSEAGGPYTASLISDVFLRGN